MNIDKVDSASALKRVLQTGALSPSSKPDDVAAECYALFEYALERKQPWFTAMSEDERYYRGEQLGKMPWYRSKIVDNQMIAVVDTMRPRILDSIANIEIKAMRDEDIEVAKALSQRVQFAKRKCRLNDQYEEMVDDILIRGGTYVQCFQDVSAYRTDPRSHLRDPDAPSFHDSAYHIIWTLKSPGRMFWEYKNKAKRLKSTVHESEIIQNMPPSGPPDSGNESGGSFAFETIDSDDTTVHRYSYDQFGEQFEKAAKVLSIEVWIHDMSQAKGGGKQYPHGRIVNIAVAADASGQAIANNKGERTVQTLLDRPNWARKLYEATESKKRYKYGRFPFTEVLAFKGGYWSQSVIRPLKPLQDGLNALWNQMMDNARKVINPKAIVPHWTGLKPGSFINAAAEVIYLPPESTGNPRDAIVWTQVPPIINQLMPLIDAHKIAIREVSGVLDVTRGEKPGSVTAASAINLLQVKAENRILLRAHNISNALEEVEENLAYIAMEHDDEIIEFPNVSNMDEEPFTRYNPQELKAAPITIRVEGVRRKSMGEMMDVIAALASAEAQMPGSGELLLLHEDDPRLHELYVRLKAMREQQSKQQQEDEFIQRMVETAVASEGRGNGNAVQK